MAKKSRTKRSIFPLLAVIPVIAAIIVVITEDNNLTGTVFNQAEAPPTKPASKDNATVQYSPVIKKAEAPESEIAYQTPKSLGENPFASSLEGTDIDGNLKAGPDGNLIVDIEAKDFFDYFLNTAGEVTPETALAQIETLARESLPAEAANQAIALLGQYLDYKQQTVELGNREIDPALQQNPQYQFQMLKSALADLKQLRRNTFDPKAHQAFFGLQEAYGDYTLASIEIQKRDDLTPESKQTLLEWQRNQLPDQLRKTETKMINDAQISQQRQEAIVSASSPADAGARLRDLGVDPQQAEEVEGYLREREQFDQKFRQYQQALASLENAGISEGDFDNQRNELLQRHFKSDQARTWAKLESLGADSPR